MFLVCRAFEVRCLHIPVNDRTPFEGTTCHYSLASLFYSVLILHQYQPSLIPEIYTTMTINVLYLIINKTSKLKLSFYQSNTKEYKSLQGYQKLSNNLSNMSMVCLQTDRYILLEIRLVDVWRLQWQLVIHILIQSSYW